MGEVEYDGFYGCNICVVYVRLVFWNGVCVLQVSQMQF